MAWAQPNNHQHISKRLHTGALPMSVIAWRVLHGKPQSVFAYAGEADRTVVEAILRHVQCLAGTIPGDWNVDVVALARRGQLVQHVKDGLDELRRPGLSPRLALLPPTSRLARPPGQAVSAAAGPYRDK